MPGRWCPNEAEADDLAGSGPPVVQAPDRMRVKASMPTINQLIRKPRVAQKARKKVPTLQQSPQKRRICTRVYTTPPKKPNSALATAATPRMTNGRGGIGHIPGGGNNLQEHATIRMQGRR